MIVTFAGKFNTEGKEFERRYNGELDEKIQQLEDKIFTLKRDFEAKHNIFLILQPNEITAVIDFDNSIF